MGLSNVAVSRLTQTWERLPSKVFHLSRALQLIQTGIQLQRFLGFVFCFS